MTVVKIATRRQLAQSVVRHTSEFQLSSEGGTPILLRKPYRGVLQGLAIEGSSEGYLWRIRLFSFHPVLAAQHFILSNAGRLDHLWLDSRSGIVMNGKVVHKHCDAGMDLLRAVVALYEDAYRPWLIARETPEKLLEQTEAPKPANHWNPPVWYSSQIQELIKYCLTSLACGRVEETQAMVESTILQLNSNQLPEQQRQPHLAADRQQLEDIAHAASLSQDELRKWITERETLTFRALKLDREGLISSVSK